MPELPTTPSTPSAPRSEVTVHRTAAGRYEAVNARGGRLPLGIGEDETFTPVEALLAAIAGCGAVDVDIITTRRAEPESFEVTVSGSKIRGDEGNRLGDVEVTFRLRFPEGEAGDAARQAVPRAVEQSAQRLCTVSRTVSLGTPVTMRVG